MGRPQPYVNIGSLSNVLCLSYTGRQMYKITILSPFFFRASSSEQGKEI